MASPSSKRTMAVPTPAITNVDSTSLQAMHDTSMIKRILSWMISFLVSLAIQPEAQSSEQEPLEPETESWEDAQESFVDQALTIASPEPAIDAAPHSQAFRIDDDIWMSKKEKLWRHCPWNKCCEETRAQRCQLVKRILEQSGNTDFWNGVIPEKHGMTRTPPDPLNCSTSMLLFVSRCVTETKYARARRELEAVTAELSSGLLKAELAKRNAATQDRVEGE